MLRKLAHLALVAVVSAVIAQAATASPDLGENPNPALFPKSSQPYGADLATWADRESQLAYAQPLAKNPLVDQTGADCGVGQDGQVWLIPRILGPRVFSGSRSCTIPAHKAIFLEIGAYVNPYPCPDRELPAGAGACRCTTS